MVQDLDFFPQKFIRYGSGLEIFFPIFFFHYGSGLTIFFSNNNSLLWLRTQIFFRKNLFAMVHDLDLFPQQFICYGSGLSFFYIKIYLLWFRTQKFFSIFFFTTAQKSGLNFFFHKNFFSMVQDLDFFPQKFIRYGSGLEIFFSNFFFHYGSGLRIFFPQKFLSHGSGL